MKKLFFLSLLITILSSCNNNTPIDDLKYITIAEAKRLKADSMVIVTEGCKDYVFAKHSNGDVTLKAQYVSGTNFLHMPMAFFIWILLVAFAAGLIVGLVINNN